MWLNKPGNGLDGIKMIGSRVIPVYLVGNKKKIIIEGGISAIAKDLIEQISYDENTDHGHEISRLVITHSHFDHCGAVPYLLSAFPRLKTAASMETKNVFSNERAIRFIEKENNKISKSLGMGRGFVETEIDFTSLDVDIVLDDGGRYEGWTDLGVMEIIITPGHSKCSLSLWFPEHKYLFVSDAAGFFGGPDNIFPFALNNILWQVDDVERFRKLAPEVMAFGHFGMLTDRDIESFFDTFGERTQVIIETALNNESEPERAVEYLVERYYVSMLRFLRESLFREAVDRMVRTIIDQKERFSW